MLIFGTFLYLLNEKNDKKLSEKNEQKKLKSGLTIRMSLVTIYNYLSPFIRMH